MTRCRRRGGKHDQRKRANQASAFQAAVNGGGDADDDVRRKAVMDVVQMWLDRLQLISVIVSLPSRTVRLNSVADVRFC